MRPAGGHTGRLISLKHSLHDILKGQKHLKTADGSIVLSHTDLPPIPTSIQQLKHKICFSG